ncbi:MAG: hypothetical protein WAU47_13530 [Desulfobaccales bacterium]
MPLIKAAWMLLCLCLLAGDGKAEVCPKVKPKLRVMLVLDLKKKNQVDQAPAALPQAARLLVHLLRDHDSLGVMSLGESQELVLPPARLSPEQRARALDKLAGLAPAPQQQPDADLLQPVLELLRQDEPEPRLLFILTDREEGFAQNNLNQEEWAKLAAQTQAAGVTLYGVSPPSTAAGKTLEILAQATGGRVWEGKTVFEVQQAILNLYETVSQPQEVPMHGNDFRLDPWVRRAVVAAARSSPETGVILKNPRGEQITPGTSRKGVGWEVSQGYDRIVLSQPRPGIWSLAGARGGDSRIFLDTDLTLDNAGTPKAVGEDEALRVAATLSAPKEVKAQAKLRAELQVINSSPLTAQLHVPETGQKPAFFPEAWVGRFPPVHQEGEGTLRILVSGRGFERLLSLPITITAPWYRGVVPKGGAGALVRFQPEPTRRLQDLEGTLSWQSAQGALAGVFFKPPPGSEIVMAQPKGPHDLSLADLRLKGAAPDGRLLDIASGPHRLMITPEVPETTPVSAQPASLEKKSQDGAPAPSAPKGKRRWLWLVLAGSGGAIILACGYLLIGERLAGWRARAGKPQGAPSEHVLMLQAQVEVLTKEKVQMQTALEEKTLQVSQALAKKEELTKELERFRERYQSSSKTLEELEKKLQDAEQEAKGVQEEYMALYARNQQEKEGFQKK